MGYSIDNNILDMNILIFNSLYYPNIIGGAEKSVQLIAEKIVEDSHRVSVFSLGEKNSKLNINGVDVHYVKTKNIYRFLSSKSYGKIFKFIWHFLDIINPFYVIDFVKFIKKKKVNVIWTNNLAGFSVVIWLIARILNIPVVHTIRDYYLLCPSTTMFSKGNVCSKQCSKCKFFSFPKKILSKNIDCVVGISEHVLKKHEEYGYFKNSRLKKIIFNSVDDKKDGGDVFSNLKEGNKIVKFGFLGSLNSAKGLEFLLEESCDFFREFKYKNSVQLIIGGEGDFTYVEFLKKKYAKSNIIFLGRVETSVFFSNIDYLVVPSLWEEPFGRVVIEAFQHGKMVLASKSGGLKEFSKFGNIELFEVKKGCLSNLLRKFAVEKPVFDHKRWDSDKKYFCLKNIADQYIKIFKSLC